MACVTNICLFILRQYSYIGLEDLVFTLTPRLLLKSQQPSCFSLPCARITGIHYYAWIIIKFLCENK